MGLDMTKKSKQQTELTPDTQSEEKMIVDAAATETANTENQHADSSQNAQKTDRTFDSTQAKTEPSKQAHSKNKKEELPKTETVVVKKSNSGLALLAILLALALGGAGYYFGQQQVDKIQQKLTELESKAPVAVNVPDMPDFTQERAQLDELTKNYRTATDKITVLEKDLLDKQHAYASLQAQINKLSSNAAPAQPNNWLLSEADFLLTNAQRKLVLDYDVDTAIALLNVANEILENVSDPHAIEVRAAIRNDLKQLSSIDNVDQNAIMQKISQLANTIDELEILDVNFADTEVQGSGISDDVSDWRSNLRKSAGSFLNHFIRITPRNTDAKPLLAPNQDIYLRENIRLRLQIAILAVPRQQNELYKQSLETVASWVRSYFDTSSETAVNFLKSIDDLAEQSIYIDVPDQLGSLNILNSMLNKQTRDVQKIELSTDKELIQEEQTPSTNKENVASETKPADAETQQQ